MKTGHVFPLAVSLFSLSLGCSTSTTEALPSEVPEARSVVCETRLTPNDVTLDPDEVHDVAEAHARILRMCYERSLDLNPTLEGKIDVALFVDEKGRPTEVCSAGSTLPNRQVVECVIHVFSQFRFAERERATASLYPVNFRPH
jgi:hypothetical protein